MRFSEISHAVLSDVTRCVGSVDPAAVEAMVDALAAKRRAFLIGAGRSGCVLEAMSIRLRHLGIETHIVGTAGCPPIQSGDLVLVGSGSGTTPVPLEQTIGARDIGADVIVITAAPASPIAKLARVVVHIPAPVAPKDGTPHTLRSLFEECLLLVCDCACRMLQDRLGLTTDDMQSRHSMRE